MGDGHGSAEDCHGHGTHVAGTIGGVTYGVAKGVSILVGRVVNCSGGGFVSTVISAVDWVTQNHMDNDLSNSVVSMSLGYGNVQSLRDAVQASVGEGIHYSVAAGNGNFFGRPQDACKESPAGAPGANTVGATNITDQEASFSNYGTCVDILAPGIDVESALLDGGSVTKSGTSMATPHVTGAIALYLTANSEASPAEVSTALQQAASVDKMTLHRSSQRHGTPNLLLNTQGSPGPAVNEAPVADFTFECTDFDCDFTDESTDDGGALNLSRSWDFGDGESSTDTNPTHSYVSAGAGTYTVTFTVTDAGNLMDSRDRDVTVSEPTISGSLVLTADGRKVRGRHVIDLSWTGGTDPFTLTRDGTALPINPSGTSYTDVTGNRGGATYVYEVCDKNNNECSSATVVY